MHSRGENPPPAVLGAFAGTVCAGGTFLVAGVAGGLRAPAGGLAAVSGGLQADGGAVGPRPGFCTEPCGRMMPASSVGLPRVKAKGSACVLRAYGSCRAASGVHRRLLAKCLRAPLLPLLLLLSGELSSLQQWSERLRTMPRYPDSHSLLVWDPDRWIRGCLDSPKACAHLYRA